jgi:thiol:disulfide interchange protein
MPKKKSRKKNTNSQILVIAGLALVVAAVFLVKNSLIPESPALAETENAASQTASATLPEDQLDQALEAGRPVLAFFHSLTCTPCKQMTGIVEEVYPEFENEIVLVDVDVYDQVNEPLLRRALVRTIPSVVFIDRSGQGQTYIGVMPADQLRAVLAGLAGR